MTKEFQFIDWPGLKTELPPFFHLKSKNKRAHPFFESLPVFGTPFAFPVEANRTKVRLQTNKDPHFGAAYLRKSRLSSNIFMLWY